MNSKLQDVLAQSQALIARTQITHKRHLYSQIDLDNRLIAIKGARGSGKTTLLLQIAKENLPSATTLYVSMEHIYFYEENLFSLAKEFILYGGEYLLLDEVHKYPRWSREIKLIYDTYPEVKILFTSSSLLELHRSEADLSRRLVAYRLPELSFREYIVLETGIELPSYSIEQIVRAHVDIVQAILPQIKPLPLFKDYLTYGAYPYYLESKTEYHQKLMRTINLVIETDIPSVEATTYGNLLNIKKLLGAIATSAPFTPNISKLSSHIGLSRNHVVQTIKILERAGLLIALYRDRSGIGYLTKPEKLYLNNSNLLYALTSDRIDIGTVRETFMVNQLTGQTSVHLHKQVDLLVGQRYHIEIGGRNKKQRQLAGLENAYVAKDDIEVGTANIIPLWLFGFVY